MKVLVIADDPEAPAFEQITGLQKTIEELTGKVDMLTVSKTGICFNKRKIGEKAGMDIGSVQNLLASKRYSLVIVSLETDNLTKLFFGKSNIMQLLRNSPSRVRMYVFGASKVLNEIAKSRMVDIFSYSRPGVAKITKEFKNAILDYVKKEEG